jgi:hypothetical protein
MAEVRIYGNGVEILHIIFITLECNIVVFSLARIAKLRFPDYVVWHLVKRNNAVYGLFQYRLLWPLDSGFIHNFQCLCHT